MYVVALSMENISEFISHDDTTLSISRLEDIVTPTKRYYIDTYYHKISAEWEEENIENYDAEHNIYNRTENIIPQW